VRSRPVPRTALALLGAAGLAAGCASVHRVELASCPSRQETALSKVFVQYLGVGGFLLKHGTDVVLTAPLYSNPSLLEVGFDHAITSDTELIDRLLPYDAMQAKAILVGHSHYDHLMDVPYLALCKATQADVYGSTTTQRLLAPIAEQLKAKEPPTRVIALDEVAGSDATPGEWQWLGEGVRFMALRSEHSPQVTVELPVLFKRDPRIPFHLWRGELSADRRELPRSASEWVEGKVFAFVIDFFEAKRLAFRIYYQDSGTNEPVGHVPPAVLDEHPVDLALLCLGGDFHRLKGHPEGILANLKPRFVILSHWEDFFVNQKLAVEDGGFQGIPSANLFAPGQTKEFVKRAERAQRSYGERPWLPCPTKSTFAFPIQ
jgi:hypothetical protein